MKAPIFLSLDEVLYIHEQEIIIAGGEPNLRDKKGVEACIDAPKASMGENTCMICLEWPQVTLRV